MPMIAQKITPCLWFDTEAEEAAPCVDGRAGRTTKEGIV
jgi:hypothetical protein